MGCISNNKILINTKSSNISYPFIETTTSPTVWVNLLMLTDVVAYVEVRTGAENRSRAVMKELALLGATLVTKLTNEVTHVIFKEGRKSTKERALKKGLHLVSVLWVDRLAMLVLSS